PQCDAAPKAERARAHPAQTDAHATAPRAKDQTQLATQPSALPQAPLRSPHITKAERAPLQQPKPPAAQPQAAQGRSCAGSRAAQQHPQAQLPAPPHPARREAEPPAGSCSVRRRPPAAPKTTADAAHTTTPPRQDAQPHATPAALHPPPQPLNQPRYRRRFKQAADRYLNTKARTQAADQTRRQQRMAPKRKKVVVDPNTLQSQYLGKQSTQQLLPRAARQTRYPSTNLRRRQRSAVQLPVRRQRKTIQNNDRCRHHVAG